MLLAAAVTAAEPDAGPAGSPPGQKRTISWAASTLRLVARGGDYGRMVRLADGRIGCVYDRDGRMWIQRSKDEAMTWDAPIEVAAERDCWLTNADLLQLRDGTLLYFWNERPLAAVRQQGKPVPDGSLTRPFRIRMARSTDNGSTWSEPKTLHEAGVRFEDGCWEPAGLELPSGELQVYFADESPFRSSAEQQISMVRSLDGGRTWSSPAQVVFRAGHRDGMPSPLLLPEMNAIAVAIEDNGYAGERFKPVIATSPVKDSWAFGGVTGDSPRRWSALAEPLEPDWYGGAPYLCRLPYGLLLLSFQESADGGLESCRMAVCVGDASARHFTAKTYPFAQSNAGRQLWNSLFVRDSSTVIAVSGTTLNGTRGIWAIDGQLTHAATQPATARESERDRR